MEGALPRLGGALAAELAQGVEHPVTGDGAAALDEDQRLFDQVGERVDERELVDVRDDRARALERPAAREDRERPNSSCSAGTSWS
jgi:hypothetical protein